MAHYEVQVILRTAEGNAPTGNGFCMTALHKLLLQPVSHAVHWKDMELIRITSNSGGAVLPSRSITTSFYGATIPFQLCLDFLVSTSRYSA